MNNKEVKERIKKQLNIDNNELEELIKDGIIEIKDKNFIVRMDSKLLKDKYKQKGEK